MKKISIENNEYELIKDKGNCFNNEDFQTKVTDYFYEYDYIFGDYAYDKLRLKGYYDDENPKSNKINQISSNQEYIDEYCAYGAKYFLLKKVK